MFRFKTGDADSPRAGPPTESPYLLSPVGQENPLGNTTVSPKRAPRKIARSPFKASATTTYCISTYGQTKSSNARHVHPLWQRDLHCLNSLVGADRRGNNHTVLLSQFVKCSVGIATARESCASAECARIMFVLPQHPAGGLHDLSCTKLGECHSCLALKLPGQP